MQRKVVIIGSGPAAWTAAIYAARAELKPLVYAGFQMGGRRGGQLTTTTEVENYPGFAIGIGGIELIHIMEEQARRFGTDVLEEDVLELELSSKPFIVRGTNHATPTDTVIIATGAYAKRMNIPGDQEFWNKGISACAVCDGALPIFRNKELLVIGGGDSACEESLFLTRFASMVHLVHRRDEFRASKIMLERVKGNPKIRIHMKKVVEKITGDKLVSTAIIKDVESGEITILPVSGVFYAIGHQPNTLFLNNQVETDDTGYIKVQPGTTLTSVPGVFAAGDVFDKRYRQAITAAGTGCMAALDAEKYLEALHHSSSTSHSSPK